jgi:hypothetical protein
MDNSIAEEYIFNGDKTVGGYPISNLINVENDANKMIGGGDVLDQVFVNHKRFENLVVPVGLACFSFNDYNKQIGGYQPGLSIKSKSKSKSVDVISPEIHQELIDEVVYKKYNRLRNTLGKGTNTNKSRRKSKN